MEKNSRGVKQIVAVGRNSSSQMEPTSDLYTLRRIYYKNASDPDVRKIISKLYGGLNFDGIFSYTDKTFLRLKNPSIEQILNKNFEQKNRGPQPKS